MCARVYARSAAEMDAVTVICAAPVNERPLLASARSAAAPVTPMCRYETQTYLKKHVMQMQPRARSLVRTDVQLDCKSITFV